MTVAVSLLDQVVFDDRGLVPAIVQQADSGAVLMMAWMNRESLALTIEDGVAVYWSRSRGKLWRKGEQSGHTQVVKDIRLDCDGDTLLLVVEQMGGIACHTGRTSCFYRTLRDSEWIETDPILKDPKEIYS